MYMSYIQLPEIILSTNLPNSNWYFPLIENNIHFNIFLKNKSAEYTFIWNCIIKNCSDISKAWMIWFGTVVKRIWHNASKVKRSKKKRIIICQKKKNNQNPLYKQGACPTDLHKTTAQKLPLFIKRHQAIE